VRESWWLLVVAVFAYLALILATYQRTDPGWSFSGTGAAIHNKGGAVGAWLADLLLYLFGISAWWWVFAGIVLVVTGYRHLTRSIDAADRHHPWLAVPGFALVLLSSSALEALRLYRVPALLPHSPGGALGEMIGSGFSRALGFNGGTLLLIALFAIGWSLFTGMSWLRLMERVGAGIERLIASLRHRRDARRDREIGAVALEERGFVEAARESIEDR
jgi:S-DNA-T family DNA segregation ATPase FtsK/SpoIIIE